MPSEWADAERHLATKSSPEPGPWRTKRTPFLKELMDTASDFGEYSMIKSVAFMKGHQIGATEGILCNIGGWTIAESPCPFAYVLPNEGSARTFIDAKLDPMIDATPSVRRKIHRISRAMQRNKLFYKDFDRGSMAILKANVATDLASHSLKRMLCDEVDEYVLDLAGEGRPIELIRARMSAYSRSFLMMASTPREAEKSTIMLEFDRGDKRYFFVPCPHCGHYQTLDFGRFRWKNMEHGTPDYSSVWMECEECNGEIHEGLHKTEMLEAGKWRPTKKSDTPSHRSYHLSALYSPLGFLSWTDIVATYYRGKKDEKYHKAFLNLHLGLPSKSSADATPAAYTVMSKRGTYKSGKIPTVGGITPQFLVSGSDVQQDRIETLVMAFHKRHAFVIDHQIHRGATNAGRTQEAWMHLTNHITSTYEDEIGSRYRIVMNAIDCGYMPWRVFDWVRGFSNSEVKAVKGVDTLETIVGFQKLMNIDRTGTSRSTTGNIYQDVNTGFLKDELYTRLSMDKPHEADLKKGTFADGFIHFPEDFDLEFFEQVCSEEKVAMDDDKNTRRKFKWRLKRHRNEALDLMVYCLAMYHLSGAWRWADKWDRFLQARKCVYSVNPEKHEARYAKMDGK